MKQQHRHRWNIQTFIRMSSHFFPNAPFFGFKIEKRNDCRFQKQPESIKKNGNEVKKKICNPRNDDVYYFDFGIKTGITNQ